MTIRTTDTFKGKTHSNNAFKLPCCEVIISQLSYNTRSKLYYGSGWRIPMYTHSKNPTDDRIRLDDMVFRAEEADGSRSASKSYFLARLVSLGFQKTVDSLDTYFKGLTFYDN